MKHRRERVGVGIYLDRGAYAATVKVKSYPQKEKRFPLDTPIEDIRDWQDKTRGQLLIDGGPPAASTRGTFTAAVQTFLARVKGRPCYASYASHLAAWVERVGTRKRSSLTAGDVALALAAWRQDEAGGKYGRALSTKTLLHRYTVLQALYRTLDGPKAFCPCDGVPRPKPQQKVPQDVELQTIRRVLSKLRHDPQTHARLLVLATTGKRPAEVMRAEAPDVNLRRKVWTIRPAKGGEPQQVFLNADMIAAWQAFKAADAWGPYDTSIYGQKLRAAGWPVGVRPYNVRHALAIDLLRRGADLSDVQAHLGHKSIETTRRHYAGVLTSRQKETSQRLDGRFAK